MTAIYFKTLTDTAIIPTYGSDFAAGMDLYADESLTIYPGTKAMVSTGIAVAIEPNTYLRIAPRSGLAHKNAIDVLAGVVDEDYRGELKVILINLGNEPFVVTAGDRIAQAINEVINRPEIRTTDTLPDTARATGGFGSTGV